MFSLIFYSCYNYFIDDFLWVRHCSKHQRHKDVQNKSPSSHGVYIPQTLLCLFPKVYWTLTICPTVLISRRERILFKETDKDIGTTKVWNAKYNSTRYFFENTEKNDSVGHECEESIRRSLWAREVTWKLKAQKELAKGQVGKEHTRKETECAERSPLFCWAGI